MDIFDLNEARMNEADRRLRMLGEAARGDRNYNALRQRSKETGVPLPVLANWRTAYQSQGMDGLMPQDWQELDSKSRVIALERFNHLKDLAEDTTDKRGKIAELADRLKISHRTAERLLTRYWICGLWGLAPKNEVAQTRKKKKQRPQLDLGTLSESQLQEVHKRLNQLSDLADMDHTSDEVVKRRAVEVGVSSRTLWNYLTAYRQYGLGGLAPKTRSDKNSNHGISDKMVEIVKGIRLSRPDATVNHVHEEACERAQVLGELEPSKWKVRRICAMIPKQDKLLADGRRDEFRSKLRITHSQTRDEDKVIYLMDHTVADVLVVDQRPPKVKGKSGTDEIRPHLSLIMDWGSRLILGAIFAYDKPDRFTDGALIRQALLRTAQRPFGGIPQEIRTDQGKDFTSDYLMVLTQELKIRLDILPPHQPQLKGAIERFFGTLNTRLWSTLPGYVGSNTIERNPRAKAQLTMAQLAEKFWGFINKYHNEVHSQLGVTPMQYWTEHSFALPIEDPRLLDLLLKEVSFRTVSNDGIDFEGRSFWHIELGDLVGRRVQLRAEPVYANSDEIEVFYDGKWVCTAIAKDSPAGRAVTAQEIRSGQELQRNKARNRIEAARQAVNSVEVPEARPQEVPRPDPVEIPKQVKKAERKKSKPDLLDRDW
jgi:putative transposase